MPEKEKRILLLSDFHLLTVPLKRQKEFRQPKVFRGLINRWKRWNVSRIYPALSAIKKTTGIDTAIMCGDFVECEYNQRGIGDSDAHQARVYKRMVNDIVKGKVYYVAGNHELGYKRKLGCGCGISKKSLDNFTRIFGKPFYSFSIGRFCFIILCSSLFTKSFDHVSSKEQVVLEKLKKEQERFLIRTLKGIGPEKAFIFLHNPKSLLHIDKLLDEESKAKITKVFAGHYHTRQSLAMHNIVGRLRRKDLPKLSRKYRLQIIPALGGFLGYKGGFQILNLYNDGTFTVKEYHA
jgi:predicted MPP superfamily phosphohydrolase